MTSRVQIVALGGLDEVGMEPLFSVSGRDRWSMQGIGFDPPGTETTILTPDFSWLEEHADEFSASSSPMGTKIISVRSRLTLGRRCTDSRAPRYAIRVDQGALQQFVVPELVNIVSGEVTELGDFKFRRYAVHHSIPEAFGLII
ncbi:MAG: hypothetical protein R3A47_11530 [Polyangiales bacterium]